MSSNNIKQESPSINNTTANTITENPIEITGNSIQTKKKEQEEDNFYENRVLKAIPQELLDIPDLRDLAQYLQRDICIENPNVRFTDIVGLETAKGLLKEAVLLPLKYPQFFTGLLEPWKGVLLFGPPGTGKTMLAKAVATECKTTFFNISASSIVSKWRGDSEKLVRVLFELARFHQPSTIFLDELDSIMSQRNSGGMEHEGSRRMKTELLIQLDGLIKNKERVFLLAASNLPWDLDVAMLRRLEKRILVPLPELKSREAMLQKFLPPGIAENLNYLELAKQLENYSGSDLRLVCKESAMKPVRRIMKQLEDLGDLTLNYEPHSKKQPILNKNAQEKIMPGPVLENDIEEALLTTKPTLILSTEKYVKWEKEFGST